MLEGQVAVITGGTRGIGRAIAEAYLARGASIVVNGRSPEKGERALAEMRAGERAVFAAGDVTCQADVEAVVQRAQQDGLRVAALHRDGLGDAVDLRLGARDKAHFCAVFRQRGRRRPAYAPASACDQRPSPVKAK